MVFIEIVVKDNIKGTFDDPFEGIEIQDLLRLYNYFILFLKN